MTIQLKTLRITEVFYSLQGEANTVGWPTVFIRLTGCPLRCTYCDTSYAFYGGNYITINDILQKVAIYKPHYVTVTGGEPLTQPACHDLLSALCDQDYIVSIETSGAIDLSPIDPRVISVVDIKTPGSGEVHRNLWNNISLLSAKDQIKFVLCDRTDYDWAKDIIDRYQLIDRCTVLFSASYKQLDNRELAEWMLADQLAVRFQLQMHKYIWGDMPGK